MDLICIVAWTARRSNQSILREISPDYSLEGLMLKLYHNTLATWCEELTHWKRPWCWERVKAGGEGDARGWDGWMASLTRWTWVWARSGRWWWTGKPGVLQPMGSQRVIHDRVTEVNWTDREKIPEVVEKVKIRDKVSCRFKAIGVGAWWSKLKPWHYYFLAQRA